MIVSVEVADNFPKKRLDRHIEKMLDESLRLKRFNELDKTRIENVISIKDLADRAGYDKCNYINYRKGIYIPSQHTLEEYTEAMKIIIGEKNGW